MARAVANPRSGYAPAAARPVVRDFAGRGSAYDVHFDPRTAYDFIISTSIGDGSGQDLAPEDMTWLATARAAIGDEARADLDACFGDSGMAVFSGLTSIIVDTPEVRDAKAVMDAFADAGTRGVARAVLIDNVEPDTPRQLIEDVLDGKASATDALTEHVDEGHRQEVLGFLTDIDAGIERLQGNLSAWLPRFREIEPRVADLQRRDVASRASDRAGLDPSALIEKTTGGLRWLPEPRVKRVIMAPSYFSRPFNYIYQGRDWRMFAYPIADDVVESGEGSLPPASMVRLYRALGDPTRMRVLRLLSEKDMYLTELATQLDLSKPTMKHHLAQLRAAGLVTVIEEGSLTYYSLRRERLDEAGVELRRFIG